MGFSKKTAERASIRAGFKCERCGKNLAKKRATDVSIGVRHSATGLHLVGGPITFLVTDPPPGFESLKGKRLNGKLFLVGQYGYPDDAFFLCPDCHNEIHVEALAETKRQNPGYKGGNASPAVLENVTMLMIASGRD